jgi:hypothetical protein
VNGYGFGKKEKTPRPYANILSAVEILGFSVVWASLPAQARRARRPAATKTKISPAHGIKGENFRESGGVQKKTCELRAAPALGHEKGIETWNRN